MREQIEVEEYCEALRTWARVSARSESDVAVLNAACVHLSARYAGEQSIRTLCEELEAWARARPGEGSVEGLELAIRKSNLLVRLIYDGQALRIRPCPTHGGHFGGCPPNPCADGCTFGNTVTGWLPEVDERSRKRLEQLIASGDGDAAYNLGRWFHDEAPPDRRDQRTAIRHLRAGMGAGHGECARRLGHIFLTERADAAEAVRCFRAAIAAGDERSYLNLGTALLLESIGTGDQATPNPVFDIEEGLRVLGEAGHNGDVEAMIELAFYYLDPGFPRHSAAAGCLWLEAAAREGFLQPFKRLLEARERQQCLPLIVGALVRDDAGEFKYAQYLERALPGLSPQQLLDAARAGRSEALHDLGVESLRSTERKVGQAFDNFIEGARLGNTDCMYLAGAIQVFEVGYKSISRALPHLLTAADREHDPARRLLKWMDTNVKLSLNPLPS